MLFLVRAAVVIGGLSYLATLRDHPDSVPSLPAVSTQILSAQIAPAQISSAQISSAQGLAAAWEAVPAEARERMVRDGADALVRRLGASHPISADTLAEADRRPPWRGVASR